MAKAFWHVFRVRQARRGSPHMPFMHDKFPEQPRGQFEQSFPRVSDDGWHWEASAHYDDESVNVQQMQSV